MAKKKFDIPWWDEWYESDCLDKIKKVQNLPVLKEHAKSIKHKDKKIEKALKHSFYSVMNSLFEDLANYMHEKLK